MDVRTVNWILVFKRIISKTIFEGYKCDRNICICKMYVYIYIYRYIYRFRFTVLYAYILYMCIYTHIYINIYVDIYLFIYCFSFIHINYLFYNNDLG